MLRSRTMHTIHEFAIQGKSVAAIAREVGVSRATVRKYRDGAPTRQPYPARATKLDPFYDQIRRWVQEDHLYNCVSMLHRLRARGYTGGISALKAVVHPLRPAAQGKRPVQRYETAPGEQMQFDWGEFTYEEDGTTHKLFGFVAILSYSRMRYVTFTKRADAPTLIRCLMGACEYVGGLPRSVLTDRMKSVLLEMEAGQPKWHPRFADFVTSLGIAPRVCKPYVPQTKGKVERSVSVIKSAFWPGVTFTDIDDLNRQAQQWYVGLNTHIHGTTRERPVDRLTSEPLAPLPTGFAWDRFATEERKVSWDGYLSYDGVLYGVPGEAAVAGTVVQVREHLGTLQVWSHGERILQVRTRARSREFVPHPTQFQGVATAAAASRVATPMGHQVPMPVVVSRPLADYNRLCGVEVSA